jgi:type VI secretion system secreted protein VgrG
MATYIQAKRPITVETVLGKDELLLEGFYGDEAVSGLFHFTLDMLSKNPALAAKDALGTPVTVILQMPDGSERPVHGRISRFAQFGRFGGLTSYRAEMRPWLWFLSLSTDCRIFQNKSTLEIIEQVFKDQGFTDFDLRCTKSYAKREYCVQYRETHLNFVTRLMEEDGIFYFFEHTPKKHTLVLADATSSVKPMYGVSTVKMAPVTGGWIDQDVITELQAEHVVYTKKVTLNDYNMQTPGASMKVEQTGAPKPEHYDYHPGRYLEPDTGEKIARTILEGFEAQQLVIRGESNCRGLQSGGKFELADHYRKDLNQALQLLHVQHSARYGGYRPGEDAEAFDYKNAFTAIPHSTPYRPPHTARKPVVAGSQTALVVGKAGEEIWVDKHGRVKVQFYWDRLGNKDELSSCWVRVSTQWAGKNWGQVSIPRIGQEVIVDFLEGDPDQPIIVGRVYNADQTVPYTLPANQTQSGIKSRSTKGGGTEDFNEIRLEDKKGEEQVYIHAQKDKSEVVEHDNTESIAHDESIDIGNNQTITIAKNRTESVGGDESISIDKNRTESVTGDEKVSIAKTRTHEISKNDSLNVGDNRSISVGKDDTLSVADNRSASVGKNDSLDVAKKLVISAGDEISITTGQASIVMKKNGEIKINGKDISIEGSGKITVKASSDVVIKGAKVMAN